MADRDDLDDRVAQVLDSRRTARKDEDAGDDELDNDELFDELENDDSALDAIRERRMQQLHEEISREKYMRSQDFGSYTNITDEKQLMEITAATKYAVIHFYHADFMKCAMMDSQLERLASKHFDTRFLKINVDNAPFLVTKLKVQVLPCVISFIDGQSVDRIIGFEGLGHSADTFTTEDLESRLLAAGVLRRAKAVGTAKASHKIFGETAGSDSDYDD